MSRVCDKLADEADLAEFFGLVSKHPIYPPGPWYGWHNSLALNAEHEPNHIDAWGWDDEEEIQEWVPWWAPKYVIGHLYIPFECRGLWLPEGAAAEIKKTCGNADGYSRNLFAPLLVPFTGQGWMRSTHAYHRLPIWLMAFPLPNRLIPCLYLATDLPGGFYPNQKYPPSGHPTRPTFVHTVAGRLDDDGVYYCDLDDDYDTLYVYASGAGISAIGSHVDQDADPFKAELFGALIDRDFPEWLHEQPVQRFLKLTADTEIATQFALSPRKFVGTKWESGDGTIFRPAFADNVAQHTSGLRQDTIGAYLLRNLVSGDAPTIFDALKADALAKHAATRHILYGEVTKFREAFAEHYDK
jgi:hypothetical protein